MTDFLKGQPQCVSLILFTAFSIPIAVHDLRTMRIPDFLIYLGTAVLLAYRAAFTLQDLALYLAAAVLSFLLFMAVRGLTKKGLGWADVKYSAMCGICAGPLLVFAGYAVSAVYCGVYFLIRGIKKGDIKHEAVPFAPFMALGTVSVALIPIVKQLSN